MDLDKESSKRPLRTSDVAAAARPPEREASRRDEPEGNPEAPGDELARGKETPASSKRLAALFPPDLARDYRMRWVELQSSFVDDPAGAVERGDELVAQVMKSLAESFADQRQKLEEQLGRTGEASTETRRIALRRYRAFFERLLSV
jgi:hypothetical protein